jgi:pyruvate dehydrogenase E2 component (dihydrolipoamide acetyltransferase)
MTDVSFPPSELDAVLALRKRLKKEYEVNVSVNDLIIRSAALALRDVPEANAIWDGKQGAAVTNATVDISVAVATPSGLITPIITGSDRRGLTDISAKMKDLAGRARVGKLKPEEFQGGSFTISNLGMFGIDEFSAVINPPQAAIMAVGRGASRVKVPAFAEGQDPSTLKPYTATVMTATLSFDRRVIDDAVAGQFLQVFRAYMSRPELLLL